MFILLPGTLSCPGWTTEAVVASRCPRNTHLTGPVGSETAQSCCSMPRLENVSCLRRGGKKTSQVIMYNCCCFQVCVRVNDSPASTSHHRPADLLQNIVKPAPFWVSLICLVSLTLPKGRLNAWCHKITVPMLSDVEDYTSVSKSKCYVHVL